MGCEFVGRGLCGFVFSFTGCVYILPPDASPREDAGYTRKRAVETWSESGLRQISSNVKNEKHGQT